LSKTRNRTPLNLYQFGAKVLGIIMLLPALNISMGDMVIEFDTHKVEVVSEFGKYNFYKDKCESLIKMRTNTPIDP